MSDEFLTELYKDIPKLGTGSPETIRRVFAMIQVPANPMILDVGCGTGMSSMELARISNGAVVSLDINQTYLDILRERAIAQHLSDRIRTLNQDLFTMSFHDGEFDLIWAENAIFGLGIKRALRSWHRFLKKGGYFVFSIIVQMKSTVPEDARKYWMRVYPKIMMYAQIERIILEQHYRLIGTHVIPVSESMKYCYLPLEKKIQELREKGHLGKELTTYLNLNQEEIGIVRKYGSEFYASVFYVTQT